MAGGPMTSDRRSLDGGRSGPRRGARIAVILAGTIALLASSVAPAVVAAPPANANPSFKILVFTAGSVPGGAEAALKAVAKDAHAAVVFTSDPAKFNRPHLQQYRAVVFLGAAGERAQRRPRRPRSRPTTAPAAGSSASAAAIETEPAWEFLTSILGTRATGRTAVQSATIKVADRGHVASASLPEYWTWTDAWYNFDANVRGFSHVLATVVEDPFTRAALGAQPRRHRGRDDGRSTTRSPGARTSRAAGRSTRRSATRPRRSARRRSGGHLDGRRRVGRGRRRPRLQRLRRHGPRELPADQDQRAAQPPRADRLRRVPRRARDPDDARRRGPAARPRDRHHDDPRHDPGLHEQRGRPVRARRSTTTSRPTTGSTCSTPRRPSGRRAERRLDRDPDDARQRPGDARQRGNAPTSRRALPPGTRTSGTSS